MKPTVLAGILFSLGLHTAALAGTTGKITGVVKDAQSGEAVIGASVLIEGTTAGAATDIDGYYVILNVPPGRYSVVSSAIGYSKKTVTGVTVSVDLTTTVDFQLTPTVIEGEEIVVTAERRLIKKDLTSSEARVDASQIEKLPVSEVSEVLALQAGITVDRGGGIHIRGGRTSEVAYWVDGISLSDVYDGGQAVQVDNNSVQELQVISGTFNAEYGQAMSGIVNIVTKDGDQRYHLSLSTYTGDYVTSDGGRLNSVPYSFSQTAPPTLLPNDIFYNLDKVRPFANHNIEGSLSGPIPQVPVTFYLSGRYFKSDGWLYGNRVFYPDGTTDTTSIRLVKDANGVPTGAIIGDNPVSMNDRERVSGQAKLTFQVSGSAKLSLFGLFSRINYRDYGHEWKLNPDGDVRKFDKGYNVGALWTHSLGSTSFYTINLSYFLKDFKEHLYADPFDPNYIVDPAFQNIPSYMFRPYGTNLHQFKRKTETRVAKIDYTNQISQLHQVKAGVEGKLHRLYLEDYSLAPNQIASGAYVPVIPPASSPLYEEYTEKPQEFSAYIQDKLEYERMVVNVGLRFDYFNSKGKVPADPEDPNIYLPQVQRPGREHVFHDLNGNGLQDPGEPNTTLDERLAYWYKNASTKSYVSPRFGISYPITDRGVLHFSYGHFLQIPSFINLYQKPGYKVSTGSGVQGVYGNPDLNPQKTVMYEFGLQQQLTNNLSFDVTGFYRDTRDWVSTSVQIPVRDPETATTYYTMFINRDYANSRGVTLSVIKRPSGLFSFNFSYTFQTAEGNNSNPDEEQAARKDNKEPSRALAPLDWDQRHTANLTLGLGESDWGIFAIGRYGSGLPYTPVINQAEARGEDASRAVEKNSRRRPENYTVDLRLFKNLDIAPLNLSVFVKVFNLFDRRNEVDVYGQTGRAIASPQALGAGNISVVGRPNTVETYLIRPDFYSEPREIQVGIELNL